MKPGAPAPQPAEDSDERPAEIRHIHVDATPRDRSFVMLFLAFVVAGCGALAALSVYVDPLASFGTGKITPLVPNDRDEKAAAYQRITPAPAALVIGSSRVMKLSAPCITQSTGLAAYNFGLNSARAEDYLAVLKFAQSKGPVQRVLVGVDPEALHNDISTDDRLLKSRVFAPYIDASLRAPATVRLARMASEALSWETVVGSLRALKYEYRGGRPEAFYTFDSAGMIRYTERERLVRAGRFDQRPLVDASITEYKGRYATFTALSQTRIAALEQFLEAARASGTRVDAFIPPLHPTLVAALAQTYVPARTRETEALLSDYERRGLLHFAHVTTLDQFRGDPALFYDGAHMMEGNAALLLAGVLGTPACAVQ